MNTELMFSSEVQSWSTPQWLFDKLNDEFHFTLDACADKSNHKCSKYYTEVDDGLSKSWENEVVFVNPPYGKMAKVWIQKSYNEHLTHHTTVVMLIAARPDTKVFHEVIAPFAAQIRFLKGRLKFSGNKNAAPFPSCIVVFSNKSYDQQVIWVGQL